MWFERKVSLIGCTPKSFLDMKAKVPALCDAGNPRSKTTALELGQGSDCVPKRTSDFKNHVAEIRGAFRCKLLIIATLGRISSPIFLSFSLIALSSGQSRSGSKVENPILW